MKNKNQLIVNIEELCFDERKIIDSFNYTFIEGKRYVILADNGSGKTTLFRIIAGLEKRFEGNVLLNNIEVVNPSTQIQIVFQDNRLFPWKTVQGNLEFVQINKDKNVITDRLKDFGLDGIINSYPKDLSGGEETRISLLLTFLNPPDVLLLDEPFGALEINSLAIAKSNLNDLLNTNIRTISIMVTHNLLTAYEMSDTILILKSNPLQIDKEIRTAELKDYKELETIYCE